MSVNGGFATCCADPGIIQFEAESSAIMKLTGSREQVLDRFLAIKHFSCPHLLVANTITFDSLRHNGRNVQASSMQVRR